MEEGGGVFGFGELVEEVEAHVVGGEAVVVEGEGAGGAVDEDDDGFAFENWGIDGFEICSEGGGEEGVVGVVCVGEVGEVGPAIIAGLEGFGGVEFAVCGCDVVGGFGVADGGILDPEDAFAVGVVGGE